MRRLLLLIPVFIAIGCARTNSLTEVNPDGSWKRTVKFAVAKQEGMENPGADQIFELPKGEGWTSKKTEKKDETEWVFTRSAKVDEVISKDIAIREVGPEGPTADLQLINEVTVKQIAPNRFKYRETFKWVGKKKDTADKDIDSALELKEFLPANLQTPEDLTKIKSGLQVELLRIMFGPGDPMLMNLLSNPEYGVRKMVNKLAKSFDKVLTEVYGERLPMEERRKLIAKVVSKASQDIVESKKAESSNPESAQKSGPPITMFISVRLPGRIVETDGEVDPYSGEVFWSMLPEGASLGEVSIQATCEIGG
jgi:hypothetical protein